MHLLGLFINVLSPKRVGSLLCFKIPLLLSVIPQFSNSSCQKVLFYILTTPYPHYNLNLGKGPLELWASSLRTKFLLQNMGLCRGFSVSAQVPLDNVKPVVMG